jgi:hypothetical protein
MLNCQALAHVQANFAVVPSQPSRYSVCDSGPRPRKKTGQPRFWSLLADLAAVGQCCDAKPDSDGGAFQRSEQSSALLRITVTRVTFCPSGDRAPL